MSARDQNVVSATEGSGMEVNMCIEKELPYEVKEISLQDAYSHAMNYEFGLVFMMSKRILCRVEQLPSIDWDECLEARFFSNSGELHIFEGDEGMKAVEITDFQHPDVSLQEYKLSGSLQALGEKICVQEYLDYDEDGQVFVKLTRLKGIA